MQTRTTEQNKELHVLLSRLGLDIEAKEALVYEHTRHRTIRSSEMTVRECDALLRNLRALAKNNTDDIRDRKRKRVIAHLAEAGYVNPDGSPDMVGIHQWVRRQKFKKQFNDHTSTELSALIFAADRVRQHALDRRKMEMQLKSAQHG